MEYGPFAIEPDIDENQLLEKKSSLFADLSREADKSEEIESSTIGQHNNRRWTECCMSRLTASRFGAVIKRLDHTPCHNLL